MKKRYPVSTYATAAVLLFIMQLAGCGKEPVPEAEPPARPVKMMTIGSGSVQMTWEYPGVIAATRTVDLGFEVGGKIIELPIEDGLKMQEGDLLGRLDPTDYEAARDAAVANRRAMSSAYVRAKNIFNEGAGSQAEVDKTERDIKVAEQELKKAQKALDDTSLLAPFDGTFTMVYLEPGSVANPGSRIDRITDQGIGHALFTADVAGQHRPGMNADSMCQRLEALLLKPHIQGI